MNPTRPQSINVLGVECTQIGTGGSCCAEWHGKLGDAWIIATEWAHGWTLAATLGHAMAQANGKSLAECREGLPGAVRRLAEDAACLAAEVGK